MGWGAQSASTEGSVFPLHEANLSWLSSIPYGSLAQPIILELPPTDHWL